MSRETRALVLMLPLVALGVLVARLGFAAFEPREASLAVLAMWIVGGGGLLSWLREPGSRTGSLLIVTAAAWGVACLMPAGPTDVTGWLLRVLDPASTLA